jgi:class 3 adenylate cyclase
MDESGHRRSGMRRSYHALVAVCQSCGFDNQEEARFCGRCGEPLVAPCPTCGAPVTPGLAFCTSCGSPVQPASRPPSGEERRVVTVLFVDLVGFTARAERLDPEDVRAILSPYYERVRSEIERFGGLVEKFVGDAVMGVFGAPVAYGDDPERAVRAALAVREELREMNRADPSLDLQARLAVNTGEAIVALGAHPKMGEGMVAGDVVNTASRLQSAAPTGEILVGEETYFSTRTVIDYRPSDPVDAKGKALPIPAWLAVAPMGPVGERSFSGVPMIGRGAELAVIRGIWERVMEESRPHLVTVFGPTGIGKSRLAYEFSLRVGATGGKAFRGRSIAYGESSPYGAFAQVVKQVAGIFDSDELTLSYEKLRAAVAEVTGEGDPDEAAHHIAILLGWRTEGSVSDQETLFFSARLLIEGLAARQPTVLILEDLHWAEPSLLDLIEFLAARVRDVPLLLLTLARPELRSRRQSWGSGLPAYTALALEPLGFGDALELTRRLLSQRSVDRSPDQAEALANTAEGNPLFIEEMAASLAERATADGRELPTSIRGIVHARLDALPRAERSVLMDASVMGRMFWSGAVARLQPDREDLGALLGSLEQRDLIRRVPVSRIRGEQQFTFKHILIRDVAYQTLPRAERRQRHTAVARFLEEATPDLGDSVAALALHWREAGEPERALTYLVAAADQAGRGWAKETALRLYQEALELVPEGDKDLRKDILRRLAIASQATWHVFDAERLRARSDEGR